MTRTKVRNAAAVVFLAVPMIANATPLSDVCRLVSGSLVTECFGAARGRYIDANAANVCHLVSGSVVVDCVAAIADKDYGKMVALQGTDIVRVPFIAATGVLKTVPIERYDEVRPFFG